MSRVNLLFGKQIYRGDLDYRWQSSTIWSKGDCFFPKASPLWKHCLTAMERTAIGFRMSRTGFGKRNFTQIPTSQALATSPLASLSLGSTLWTLKGLCAISYQCLSLVVIDKQFIVVPKDQKCNVLV